MQQLSDLRLRVRNVRRRRLTPGQAELLGERHQFPRILPSFRILKHALAHSKHSEASDWRLRIVLVTCKINVFKISNDEGCAASRAQCVRLAY